MNLRLALPRGLLLAPLTGLLEVAGVPMDEIAGGESDGASVLSDGSRVLIATEADVIVCVERDAADVGFVGRETLLEWRPPVSELAQVPLRQAELVFAWLDDDGPRRARRCGRVRVATPYPNVAVDWLAVDGLEVEPVIVTDTLSDAAARLLAEATLRLVDVAERAPSPPDSRPPDTVVAACDVCVIAGHAARALRAEAIADLLERLRAALPPAEATA